MTKELTNDELTPKPKFSNSFTIEKNGKSYLLYFSYDENNILIKCKIEKPLKIYEKKFSKTDLEEISSLFKAYENLEGSYIYILNSIENKQYIFNISEQYITIKLNKYINIEFKEINLPEKEIEISDKVENLYSINEDLIKSNEELKKKVENLSKSNEDLKKEINLLKLKNEELKKINLEKLENKIEKLNVPLLQGSNYGSSYNPFKVYKIGNNLIKLSGLINCTLNQSICQLPENYRPKGQLIFTTMMSSNQLVRVDILADGNIFPYGSGNVWLSLDGISFIAGE